MTLKNLPTFLNTFIGFLAGAFAVYMFLDVKYSENFGSDDNNIQIMHMKLVPNPFFLNKEFDFYGNANITITVRNFGNTKVQLTSYTLNIKGDKKLKAKSYAFGQNMLDTDPSKSKSIFIAPGEEKMFRLSSSLVLKNILPFFQTKDFKKSLYSHIGSDNYLLHNIDIYKKFNKELYKIYGKTELEIQLFTGYNKLIKEHVVKLADGITIFENNGKFQHDTFLAKVFAIQIGDYTPTVQSEKIK